MQKMNLSGGSSLPGVVEPSMEQCEKLKEIVECGEGCSYYLTVYNRFHDCRVTLEQRDVPEGAMCIGELSLDFVAGTRLIVERVIFTKRRQGTFTKVMKHLYSVVAGTSISTIEIQSVLTDEMMSWCKRYGFTPVKGHTYDAYGRGGSYVCEAQFNPLLK